MTKSKKGLVRLCSGLILAASALLVPTGAQAVDSNNVIIVLDVSGSMRGEKLTQTLQATQVFIEKVPLSLPIGLITFNNSVQVLSSPTLDRLKLSEAVARISAKGNSSLYDAIKVANTLATDSGHARIIVISDGADNFSRLSKAKLLKIVAGRKNPIDVLAIDSNQSQLNILDKIAKNSGGNLIAIGDVSRLASGFQEAQQTLVPKFYDENVTVIAASPAVKNSSSVKYSLTLLVLAIFLLGIGLVISRIRAREKFQHRKILREYSNLEGKDLMESKVTLFSVLERNILTRRYIASQRRIVDVAGIPISLQTWLGIQLGVFLLLLYFFNLVTKNIFAALFLATFFGYLIGAAYLSRKTTQRISDFERNLPDALSVIAGGLRSGLNFLQAFESIAQDDPTEVGRQFRRAMGEIQIGADFESALTNVATRMNSEDLRWAVTAVAIQRDVGGNLSEILSATSETIRGRAEIRREVVTLSAEGRTSAYVLVGLPIGIFFFMLATRPDYVALFWTDPVGVVLAISIGVLMLGGWFWVQKVVKIKI